MAPGIKTKKPRCCNCKRGPTKIGEIRSWIPVTWATMAGILADDGAPIACSETCLRRWILVKFGTHVGTLPS